MAIESIVLVLPRLEIEKLDFLVDARPCSIIREEQMATLGVSPTCKSTRLTCEQSI